MSIHNFAMSNVAGAAAQGGGFYPYLIDQSLRFNQDDSAYLSRTPASTSDRRTWTWSGWIKRTTLSTTTSVFGSGTNSSTQTSVSFTSDDRLSFITETSNQGYQIVSTVKFRDVSSWYHIVAVSDTTNAIADDRMKLYVNGVRITQLDTNTNPALNFEGTINSTSYSMYVSRTRADYIVSNLYFAEVNFIDGQALDPTSFGETINGIWVPKAYSGSYGTNGFYLSFADSAAIGDDLSGNTNDFTATNLAATDVVLDSPTNNFPTWNSIDKSSDVTLYEGNLRYSFNSRPNSRTVRATMALPSSGKYYWEFKNEQASSSPGRISFGIVKQSESSSYNTSAAADSGYINYSYGGGIQVEGTSIGTAGSYYNTERAAIAVDCDSGKFWFGKVSSGGTTTWYNSTAGTTGDPVAGSNPVTTLSDPTEWLPFGGWHEGGSGSEFFSAAINFGQESFLGNIPNGYQVMSTANLPEPTISPNSAEQADDYFNTVLWTGTGSGQSITGMGFQPDWLWFKQRNGTSDHALIDSVRGVNQGLVSHSTATEVTSGASNDLVSFDSDGFTTGTPQNFGSLGSSGSTIATWGWKAGGTASSYTPTGATASVSMTRNSTAGFSIVTYSGTGTANDVGDQALGHGLQVNDVDTKPDMMIIKARDYAGTWKVWHKDMGGTLTTDFLTLNTTSGTASTSDKVWDGAEPTSTLFSVGYDWDVNKNGSNYVGYFFASVEGYSKIGSYTGNSSADGPYVYTGFRPAWILIKSTSGSTDWMIYDSKRLGYNPNNNPQRNVAAAEQTDDDIDFLSNGFKLRRSSPNFNAATHIYLALAESPFKYSNAR